MYRTFSLRSRRTFATKGANRDRSIRNASVASFYSGNNINDMLLLESQK